MCIVTTNLEQAIDFWQNLMGFELQFQLPLPDAPLPGPKVMASQAIMDDLYKVKNARGRVAAMASKSGALIELLQPENPKVVATPPGNLRYAHTGIHELALAVDDIDAFWDKVVAAGYETQTSYIWTCADMGRTFIFYDRDGNMIQIWQDLPASTAELVA